MLFHLPPLLEDDENVRRRPATGAANDFANGVAEVPSQTKDGKDGMGFVAKIGKAIALTATAGFALQSALSPALGARLASPSGGNWHEGTGTENANQNQQKFVPTIGKNVRPITFNELHANANAFPFAHRSANVAKMVEMGKTIMAPFAPFSEHSKRKLSTNSAAAAEEANGTKAGTAIDPREYPQAPRGKVADNYNGIEVPDPYRALENPDANVTRQFVRQLNQISQPFLEASPLRPKMNQTLTNMWNYAEFFKPSFHGDLFYYYRNNGLQSQSVLYQSNSMDEPGKVFLDPNTLSKDGTTAVTMESFSKDGTVFAYGISEKGSDAVTVKFKQSKGEELPDQIADVRFSGLSWLSDGTGLFYSKYLKQSETEEFNFHSLFFHKMGTDSEKDILVVQGRNQSDLLIYGGVSSDGRFLFVSFGGNANDQMFYCDLPADNNQITGPLKLKPLFDQFDADYEMVDSDEHSALIFTNKDAPMYKLIRVNLEGSTAQKPQEVIKEDRKRRMRFAYPVNKDKLLVCYMDNVKDALFVHDLNSGKMLYQIALSFGSVIMDSTISSNNNFFASKFSSHVFFKTESSISPFTIFHADFAQFGDQPIQLEVFRQAKVPGLDTDAFAEEQVFYASKDGTMVPMFIAHRKDMKLTGDNPVLLTGYGGFGDSMLPFFSSADAMFMQHFGGVVATANIRGGGEYGEKWHEQGMLDKKQNVFDDFIAAAEYLINKQYTNGSKLAISGASNGGLLTAVCSQQRPDLFGAVITQYGVLDMLRFNKFTVGATWESEFGDPENATDFSYIYKYSPLQQLSITPGQQWPATLLTAADHDDRVVPAHTLKYTAQMYHLLRTQAESWQRNPVLAKIRVDQGHEIVGTPTAKLIDELVDFYSFLQRVLGLQWTD
ncbi:hypothetical protein niasHT_005392 [Heterodera trifolii]|uniref:Prolyl endopeptidase n=1 Tax=Heterodera trifolii TaxID=157864 RepID=A0ABD2M0V3_9BILA